MKTKNLIVLIILGIVVTITTFGLSIMSNLVYKLLLLTWTIVIAIVISSKWFTSAKKLILHNSIIVAVWVLQIITMWVFEKETKTYIPIEYRLPWSYFFFWGVIITLVGAMIVYAINKWIKEEGQKKISIIQMVVSGTVAIVIILLCSGVFTANDHAKESLYLSVAITTIEWTIFAITLYFMMRNIFIKEKKE